MLLGKIFVELLVNVRRFIYDQIFYNLPALKFEVYYRLSSSQEVRLFYRTP